jgi:hypothetical protein
MKATINGITYEGTPEEIMKIQQLQQSHSKRSAIWDLGESLRRIEEYSQQQRRYDSYLR